MKKITVLLLLLMSARVGYAQVQFNPVTVSVPQIAVGGDPGGLNYDTLVQLVNNNSSFTTAHIALFSDGGSPLSASFDGQAPVSTLDFALDSGVTRQIQITLSGAITAGWMQITYSPSDAQTTVIIQLRSGTSLLSEVGVDPQYDVMSSTDFPVETDINLNAGIAVANPFTSPAGVLVRIWDPSTGNQLGSTTLSLAGNGHAAKLLTELFPSINIGQIRAQVSLDSCSTSACTANGPGLLATALRLNGGLFTTIPVVQSPSGGSLIRVVPQVAFGGNPNGVNYQTILYLTTTATNGVAGTVDIFDDNGNPIAASPNGDVPSAHFNFSVLGNRVTRIVLSGDNTLHAGWVRLTLPASVPLIVNAVFQTFSGPNLTGEASVLEAPSVTQAGVFVHVQNGVSNIGVAFANSLPTTSVVAVTLFNSAGFAVTSQNVTLPPFGHLARFVTELFPALASTASFDGTLSMQDPTSFSAVALRLTGNNIAALPVGSTSMFRPSIGNMRISQTSRTPGQVSFSIDVTDFSADLVTSTSTAVNAEAEIFYLADQTPDDNFILIDGTSMLNGTTGTLNGTFTSQYTNIPAGYSAIFSIYIIDAAGNTSNIVSLPFKF
jgi:hypothetical protein